MTDSWSPDILAFAGPTRPVTAATPGLVWLPPAAAGDMLAAARRTPCTMVLIDGLMETRMPPLHKEILGVLAEGFRIIGAASMGALRAAELAPLGMLGVGHIFAAYRHGRLVADDEVAVLHAPAELGWRPLTEPMVDIRATLVAAVRDRVVPIATARTLRATALADNFRVRSWQRLLDQPTLDPLERAALLRWLPTGRVALKQADADAAIALARALAETPAPRLPPPPETAFLTRLRSFVDTGGAA
ncbi:MAG: tfuA protein [Alphaproteobacteria bacterium PA4]|nr:MAG: tfuA protein [Alphaproteobacteria bacterium PA4]